MKENALTAIKRIYSVFILAILCILVSLYTTAQPTGKAANRVISSIDYSLAGSQKYFLRVDGKPLYMTSIQVRLDNMRYGAGWTAANTEAVIAQAAANGFNTVSFPIHWREVEPQKDKFDFTILDKYVALANKYNLRVEPL